MPKVDFRSGCWKEGEVVILENNESLEVFAGLFLYSGFGMGNYFSKNGSIVWRKSTNANNQAKEEEVSFRYVDRLNGYKGTYLGH